MTFRVGMFGTFIAFIATLFVQNAIGIYFILIYSLA